MAEAGTDRGWLADRFGISWQIVPEALPRLSGDPDQAAAARAREARMGMGMVKIDLAAVEAALHATCLAAVEAAFHAT